MQGLCFSNPIRINKIGDRWCILIEVEWDKRGYLPISFPFEKVLVLLCFMK